MVYFNELTIEAFRGIMNLHLNNLGEINVIAGINNSGKTSILEAINLLESPLDVVNAVRVARRRDVLGPYFIGRGFDRIDSFINMFNMNSDDNHQILLSGKIENQEIKLKIEGIIEKRLLDGEEIKKKLKDQHIVFEKSEVVDGEIDFFSGTIEYEENGIIYTEPVLFSRLDRMVPDRKKKANLNIEYISPIDHIIWNERLDSVRKEGRKDEIVNLLQIFDPQIKGFEVIKDILYIEHHTLRPMPLSTYGDGLKKILLLAASVIRAKDGILLIDEIETAIHISALERFFNWFVNACKEYKVQVFATTHSLEVIDAMLINVNIKNNNNTDSSWGIDPFRIITLKKQEQKTLTRILSGEEALKLRDEFNTELR